MLGQLRACVWISLLIAPQVIGADGEEGGAQLVWSFATSYQNSHLHRGSLESSGAALLLEASLERHGVGVNLESVMSDHPQLGRSWLEAVVAPYYSVSAGRMVFTAGAAHRRMPRRFAGQPGSTNEVFAGVAYEGRTSSSYTLYRDVASGSGWYHELTANRRLLVRRRWQVRSAAMAGLNQHLCIPQTAMHVGLQLSVDLRLRAGGTVSPFYAFNTGHRSVFGTHHLIGVAFSLRSR